MHPLVRFLSMAIRPIVLVVVALLLGDVFVASALRPTPRGVTLFLRMRPPTARYNGTVLHLNVTLTYGRHRAIARAVRRAYSPPLY